MGHRLSLEGDAGLQSESRCNIVAGVFDEDATLGLINRFLKAVLLPGMLQIAEIKQPIECLVAHLPPNACSGDHHEGRMSRYSTSSLELVHMAEYSLGDRADWSKWNLQICPVRWLRCRVRILVAVKHC